MADQSSKHQASAFTTSTRAVDITKANTQNAFRPLTQKPTDSASTAPTGTVLNIKAVTQNVSQSSTLPKNSNQAHSEGTTLKSSSLNLTQITAQRERIIQALAASAQIREAIRTTECYQACQLGRSEALEDLRKEFITSSKERHISVQEKRIFEREAINMSYTIQKANAVTASEEEIRQGHHAAFAQAQNELYEALQAFFDASMTLLMEPGSQKGPAETLSWKDHELVRLTEQVKKMELELTGKRA